MTLILATNVFKCQQPMRFEMVQDPFMNSFVEWFRRAYPGQPARLRRSKAGAYILCEDGQRVYFIDYFEEFHPLPNTSEKR